MEQVGFDLAALFGQVAAAIGLHLFGQGAALAAEVLLHVAKDQLGLLSGTGEREHLGSLFHGSDHQGHGFVHGAAPPGAAASGRRRVPEGEELPSPG